MDISHRSIEPDARDKPMLQTYPTSQECYSERTRIGDEMAKANPNEHDFEIACRLNPRA